MTKTEEYSLYKKTLEKYFDLNKYKIKENPVVLNIGCGTGLDIKVQKDYCKAKTILGIDINLKHIEEATRLYGQEKGFYFTADDARFLD